MPGRTKIPERHIVVGGVRDPLLLSFGHTQDLIDANFPVLGCV
jgi:hypothetical protein